MFGLGLAAAFILVAAILAFMLGVSEYLLVYHTSGLTLSIAGIFKVCKRDLRVARDCYCTMIALSVDQRVMF